MYSISLITLSSGTIEDALNSKVPVILYDYKKRYKQIECNNDETGAAVFYIDDIEKLKIVLNNIKVSKKINYEKYVFKGSFNSNFDQKILPLINLKND